ncbi:hypothetical protein [Sphingobacterium siyangense]|uniref:hypothetical protein n=1 Tax=Sphingobacterium siyangense TaxID=459529 RepID=UPI002FDEAE23
MNIIILDHEPFSNRKKDHYYIDRFTEDQISIEYWSLVDLLPYTKGLKYTYRETQEYVRYISSKKELIESISVIDNNTTIFIVEVWFSWQTSYIYSLFQQKGIKWVQINYYANPLIPLSSQKSLFSRIFDVRLIDIFPKMLERFKNRFFLQKHIGIPYLFFSPGSNLENYASRIGKISLNYFDIIEYNKVKEESPIVKGNYLVFLDTMLIDHPDIKMYGYQKGIEGKVYLEKLNALFDLIEYTSDFEIIVAAHPKSNYKREFGKRRIFKNLTSNLVLNSKGVITHGSMSVSYAMLAEKPVYYLYSSSLFKNNEFLQMTYENMVATVKNFGSGKIIDIDESETFEFIEQIDSRKYSQILDDYFRAPNCNDNYTVIKENLKKLISEY